MDDIPLPSSPDSPGPPGEENVEKEKVNEPFFERNTARSANKSPLYGQTYSPSMVTSSPEYTPGEENLDNLSTAVKVYTGNISI